MIIVLKPWQRALCPGRLCAFVIPGSALYSSLLPQEVQILAEEQIFFRAGTKTKIPHLLTPGRGCVLRKSPPLELPLGGNKGTGGSGLRPKDLLGGCFLVMVVSVGHQYGAPCESHFLT